MAIWLHNAPVGPTKRRRGRHRAAPGNPRSLHVEEWPASDRLAWADACRPAERLNRGGAASHLAPVSQADIANRYGLYLDFLQRKGFLEPCASAATLIAPPNVSDFITELQTRVRSVTVWNSVYKLRRAAELLAPTAGFSWLAEIEKDLALVMEPRSKLDRLVLSERLVEAGLTLVAEAQDFARNDLTRARGIRNGLMIALLALCPIRLKNFAALEIGRTFRAVHGTWWIALPTITTKSRRPDERAVPALLNPAIDAYLNKARPFLLGSAPATNALWISSTRRTQLTAKNLGTLISKITLETVGVDVSPHLFRTAAASTAAAYGGNVPHLASALLNHTDPRITEEHYNRASSVSAAQSYAALIKEYREGGACGSGSGG
jgi:integrase